MKCAWCPSETAAGRKKCIRCLENHRQRSNEWRRERRAQFVAGQVCAHCGSTERLELDHIDPSQKVSHRIWHWPMERLLVEYAKCQWLCKSCHLKKTLAESTPGTGIRTGGPRKDFKHGDVGMYWRGCRCNLCRAGSAAAARDRRKQHAANGQCGECSAPVAAGHVLCERHLERLRLNNKARAR